MEEIFKYMLVAVAASFILLLGYKMIGTINKQGCDTEIAKFEVDFKSDGKSLRFGARELKSHAAPCSVGSIYLFDLSRSINSNDFNDTPIIKDDIKSASQNNVFLVKEGDVKLAFNGGEIGLQSPYVCLKPAFGKVSFFMEGAGKSIKVTLPEGQPQC